MKSIITLCFGQDAVQFMNKKKPTKGFYGTFEPIGVCAPTCRD